MGKSIAVLGAGSVGISTAIHLQQRGWDVTLIDRAEPASETSYGNAGVVNASSFVTLNNPALYKKLPAMLLNNTSYLRYNLPHVLKNLPWVFHFLKNANKQQTVQTAADLASLIEPALDEHKALMQRAGNMHRLAEVGWLKVFRQGAGFDPEGLEGQLYRRFGIAIDTLDAAAIRELEPSLAPIYGAGFLIRDSASVNNPGALLREYVQQFISDGGTLLNDDIQDLSSTAEGFELQGNGGLHKYPHLVVAAGPWSADVLSMLGYKTQLGFERGYHQHYHLSEGASLGRSVHDVESGFIVGPMEIGVRITTGVELNHRDAESNHAQLEQVLPRVREALPIGEPTDDPIWRGCRPTFPDSKPVIDRAPRHDHLWLAFGHQHIGLMSGPVTGKLVAQLASGESTDIDLQPFSAQRWIQ